MRAPLSFETSATVRPKTHVTAASYLFEGSTLHGRNVTLVCLSVSTGNGKAILKVPALRAATHIC